MYRSILKFVLILLSFCWLGVVWADQPTDAPDNAYSKALCHNPAFRCVRLRLPHTWKGMFGNDFKREIEMRLNRTNVPLKYRHWLVEPKSWKNLTYMALSPFPKHLNTHHHKELRVNLTDFAFAAYDKEGNLVYWGPASGGKKWCADLNRTCQSAVGSFQIYRIQGEACTSGKYPLTTDGGAPMPYCMHYFKGFAIHGSTLMGFVNRSRGCIRLFDSDAKWLNEHFVKLGTRVIVKR